MRVQTEEWQRFTPGVRMYQGKKTLFYNGEILRDAQNGDPLIYSWEERQTWKAVIVLPGIEVIPEDIFYECKNIETIIMSNDVRRIEGRAFSCCDSLVFVRLSRNLEYMGNGAFQCCHSLNSMFIPPSCTEIGDFAFSNCEKLIILNVPQHIQLGTEFMVETELWNQWDWEVFEDIVDWLDFLNGGFEDYDEWVDFPDRRENSLHRICCSTNEDEAVLISERIYQIVKEQGPQVLLVKNKIGVTPLQYLNVNPYLEDIDEMNLLRRYVVEKLGLIV